MLYYEHQCPNPAYGTTDAYRTIKTTEVINIILSL